MAKRALPPILWPEEAAALGRRHDLTTPEGMSVPFEKMKSCVPFASDSHGEARPETD